jgi:hypothetical protein
MLKTSKAEIREKRTKLISAFQHFSISAFTKAAFTKAAEIAG